MNLQKAIRHHTFGPPLEVLRLEDVAQAEPQAGEVRVRLLAAVINPSDCGMILGNYGRLPQLPAVAGREGVGVVDAIGPGVSGVHVGMRVRFPEDGAWQETACMPATELLRVPDDLPIDQVAGSFINPPTAYCLLNKVMKLAAGSWVVQNAGNSAVGLAVIQLAKGMGLNTISQVRREALIEPLQALGADHVVLEGSGWHERVQQLTAGEPIRLALNSVGGQSAIDQIKALGDGGTQVTFGAMVGDPVRFPTRSLIFKDVRLVGFWWDRWRRQASQQELNAIMRTIHTMMREGRLNVRVAAAYSFLEYEAALNHNKRPRLGKILLKPSDD